MTSSLNASNPEWKCEWVRKDIILKLTEAALTDDESLESLRQYCLDKGQTQKDQRNALLYTKRRSKMANAILQYVFSTHAVVNAFSVLDFGDNPEGIHRAAIDDTMHFGEGGYFKYINETFLDPLHPTEAKEIDYMVETILGRSVLRSSILGEYPRINFTRGFTRLTLLTASEKVGVLFAVYILLHTERGQEIMEKVLN